MDLDDLLTLFFWLGVVILSVWGIGWALLGFPSLTAGVVVL